MTLHQLKVFVAVAKFKSFSLAGEELRLHQPSVSIAIRGLERGLEVKLFETLGRKVRLTRAGEEMLRISEEILPKLGGIKERLAEVEGLKKGKIKVGGSALAAATFLPVAVQRFKQEHLGIEVCLKIERSYVLEKQLLEGDLDLAILGWQPRSALLMAEPYLEEETVVIAAPSHPLARKRLVSLELLAKEPLVISERGNVLYDLVEQKFSEKGLCFKPTLEINVQVGGRDAIKRVVADGLAIGFLSKCHTLLEVKAGQLKVLNVPELNLKRIMYITVHKRKAGFPLQQKLIDFLWQYKGQKAGFDSKDRRSA